MPSTAKTPAVKKNPRRTQERAEVTRAKLLEAAARLFSEQGFDGVSIRDIENSADVKRGILAYHFTDKESMWMSAVDATFGNMRHQFDKRLEILKDLSDHESIRFLIRYYVRFHANNPILSRIMSQEATNDSWRIRYLIKGHIGPATQGIKKLVMDTQGIEEMAFINWYYIMVSASSTIFSFAPECKLLFGVDPQEERMVEAHADMLVSMLLKD
jgi:AcrR family transcriptional regulator